MSAEPAPTAGGQANSLPSSQGQTLTVSEAFEQRACAEQQAAHIQRQVQTQHRRFNETDHLSYQLLEAVVPAQQTSLGKSVLQVAHKFVRIVTQQDRADTELALRNQDCAQRALSYCEMDFDVAATVAVVARTYAQPGLGGFVETAVGIEAGAVGGICDRAAARTRAIQLFAQPACTERRWYRPSV